MRYLKSAMSFAICVMLVLTVHAQHTIDLQGSWQFREHAGKDWLSAQVPGTVHTDLLAAKLIPDPFVGNSATQLQWIEQLDWDYRKIFSITADDLLPTQVELVFEGLDTYAEILLNGQLLGITDNMHRTWRFSCKPQLKIGENVLEVHFLSPMQQALPAYQASAYKLPSGNDDAEPKLSPYVRKAAYNFGWDFAPRLLTAGIWRPVYLQAWSGVRVERLHAVPLRLAPEEVPMRTVVHLDVAESGSYQIDWLLDGELVVSTTRALERGKRTVEVQFVVHQPEFWWPRGMGEPKLYKFGVRVQRNQTTLSEHTQSLGLRSIRLVMAPDSMGTSFYFAVNEFMPDRGGPVFMKGANYVPSDVFLPRGRAAQERTLQAAEAVGMNMLRVWGGGVYEDDAFYDWCDAHGIMVWQDLPFACMMYPLEGAFLENVKAELQDNVLRLRHHPSLAIWCGNNEIDVAWHNWGWQQEGKFNEAFAANLWGRYQNFFEGHVPSTLNMLDPGRAYIPTSPLSNWGKAENFKHKNMHYWGVWHGTDSLDGFSRYVPRFMSEYGFQSWPSPATLQPYIKESDWNFESVAIRQRQKSYKGNAPILKFLTARYGIPKDFSAFCQLSQYLQRDAMTLAIEAHRVREPFCMGTLYWQLNDCWPGPSWSTIDFSGEWKPAHYALKRLYGPVVLSCTLAGDSLSVQIASELPTQACNLQVRLKALTGEVVGDYESTILLQPGGREYLRIPLAALSGSISPTRDFIEVVLHKGRSVLGEGICYFVPPCRLELPDPEFNYQVRGADGKFELELNAKSLVKDFEIQIVGMQGVLSDNFFDLVPGKPRTVQIAVAGLKTASELQKMLRFRDLTRIMETTSAQAPQEK